MADMTEWVWDTNGGPLITIEHKTLAQAKRHVEQHAPIMRRRGYTVEWERRNSWHVASVYNSKGRQVHQCALTRAASFWTRVRQHSTIGA